MKKLKILIVDDHDKVRKYFRLMLQNMEHIDVVGECEDGTEVVPFLKNHAVDIVFSDVNMKYLDGFQTAKQVKQYNKKIKVIIVTTFDFSAVQDECEESKVDGFISKADLSLDLVKSELEKVMEYSF